ncbi:MAG: efflux RND transporter periplasmic adaptor subunit [Armatimonadota bacterium]
MRRAIRYALLLAVLAAVVIAAAQLLSRRPTAQTATPPPQRPAPLVRTAPVDQTQLVEQATLPGEVRASATVDVTSRVAGRLGALLVKEGSSVAAGGLIARIDDPELFLTIKNAEAAVDVQRARLVQLRAGPMAPQVAGAQAAVTQAEVSLAQAERELARARQLFADGLIARAAVDRAETDVELARGRLSAAREQVALIQHGPRPEDVAAQEAQVRQAEASVAQIRARVRDLRIASPISGVVTRLNVERGAVISTQTVVATVATLKPIEVHIPLPETDLGRLRSSSLARVRAEAFPARVFEGKIARVAPAMDAVSRSARLIVVVPNADLTLRPGMFARATVVFEERPAIVIPSEVIVRRGEATVVFVVKDQTVEERAVRVGYVEGSRSEILEGLRAGETIVTFGQQGLRDGMKVRTGGGREQPAPAASPQRTRP